jgi:formylglycine-generating enzyme required for sulfatase activity/energy-coupling factor transporter ATP-binding protein EcfA2
MTKPDTFSQALVSAVTAIARGSAADSVKGAYHEVKSKIEQLLGPGSDLFDAVCRLEKKPDSGGRKLQLEEELSDIDIAQYPHLDEALKELGKAGDHIDIHSQGDVALAKDQAIAIILKNVTLHTGADTPESLLSRYLQDLALTTNHLPWASLDPEYADPSRGQNLELVHVYTALDTTALEKLKSEDAVRCYLKRQHEARRISAQEMIDTHPRLVLFGDPGSGKSTMVNYLTHIMAQTGLKDPESWLAKLKQNGPWSHGMMLPVRIVLREFAATLAKDESPFGADLLLDYMASALKSAGFQSILHKILLDETATCLILLDGLDEVPTKRRKAVVAVIDDFAAKYKWHRYLVTCRIYAYIGQPYQLGAFHQATLTPFSPEQIENFIVAWYQALHHSGQFSAADAGLRTEKLKKAATRPDLAGLAQRPLLMTVMAMLHTFDGELPKDRVALYQRTVDLLFRRWASRYGDDKGIIETLDIAGLKTRHLEKALYAVAFDVHAGSTTDEDAGEISEGDLRKRLAAFLNDNWNKAGEFIAYVRERAGLLIRHKPEAYTFPHRTFQEFLAACHLVVGMADYPGQAARYLKEDPDRWRVVFVLAAGYAAGINRPGTAIAAVAALCPEGLADGACVADPAFTLAVVAGESLLEIGLVDVQWESSGRNLLREVRKWLLTAMQAHETLTAPERAAAGNVLARLGDPRFDPQKWFLPKEENFGFITIPAGAFRMGSDKTKDPDSHDDETPQHTVTLSAFAMAKYPVTVAQYKVFAEETALALDKRWHKWNRYDNHPVVEVSWQDAMAYGRWLTNAMNSDEPVGLITLPTEAQWEKAARGSDGLIYPWGDTIDPGRANYDDTGIDATSPVGCFPNGQSPYRMLDMAGNVDEWCLDVRGKYNEEEVVDPQGEGSSRVIRGGSWYDPAGDCRSASRSGVVPGDRSGDLGFRLVLLPGQPG